MALKEDMERQGNFLFRWRSYLPLIFLPVVFVALWNVPYLQRRFGARIDSYWETACILLSCSGLLVRILTVGFVPKDTSGRNTGGQLANTLNITGMYSVVRNPLYLANFIIILGVLLFTQIWWVVLGGTTIFWLYYERIVFAEEEFLRKKFGNAFTVWADSTPPFFPRFRNWKRPELPFSFKTVLRREQSTFLAIAVVFLALENFESLFQDGRFEFDPGVIISFSIWFVVYLVLRVLKKKHFFDVEGR